MSNTTAMDGVIELSIFISQSLSIWALFIFEFVLGISSICMNIVLLAIIVKNTTLHVNLRILLVQLSICMIWSSAGYAGKAFYSMIVMCTNPGYLMTEAFMCKLQELFLVSMPANIVSYSLVLIGLERFYATLNFRTYENSRNIMPAVLLIAVLWIGILCQELIPLMTIQRGLKMMPICTNLLSLTPSSAKTIVVLNMANEVVAVTVHLTNLRISKVKLSSVYINQAQQNLSGRFQLDQNFKTIQTILPIIAIHSACWIPKGICCFSVVYQSNFYESKNITEGLCLINVAILMNVLFGNLYAIITFSRNPMIRHDLSRLWPTLYKFLDLIICKDKRKTFRVKVNFENHVHETVRHFEMLENMWGKNVIQHTISEYTASN